MIYRLRHFENNLQIVASLGWALVIIGVITLFVGPIPAAIISILLGILFVWLQLRGKRIKVDTEKQLVESRNSTIQLKNPSMVFVNEVKLSQTVNSRVSSSHVKMYFYKAYIQDGENRIMISCNRDDQRDMNALKQIANDLNVPFELNYE